MSREAYCASYHRYRNFEFQSIRNNRIIFERCSIEKTCKERKRRNAIVYGLRNPHAIFCSANTPELTILIMMPQHYANPMSK